MQKEILEANPGANVRVYAVWFNMLPRDSRAGFPADLLNDTRVTQYWDEHHLAGTAFAPLADWHKGVLWDAYFLYSPETRWDSGAGSSPRPAELPQPASWGRTIFDTHNQLRRDFNALVPK